MSQVQSPDPVAEADRAAVETLLRCWVRETGVPRPAGGALRLELPAAGTAVEAPVRYWSPAGWHRFGPARLPSGAPACATVLAALLGAEAANGDPECVNDLTVRVGDSVRRVAGFLRVRAAAPADPAGTTPFLAAEQALLTGHPLHPTPKSREGLTEAEAARYSPRPVAPSRCTGSPPTRPSSPPTRPSTGAPRTSSPPSPGTARRGPAARSWSPPTRGRRRTPSTGPPCGPSSTRACCTTWARPAPPGRPPPPCGRCTGPTRR